MSLLCRLGLHSYKHIVLDNERVKFICRRCGYNLIHKVKKGTVERLERKSSKSKSKLGE